MHTSIEEALKHFTPNIAPAPFIVERGEGSWLWDTEGNKYLDFTGGIAVTNLGHCPPSVVKAVQEQAGRLLHTSNMFWNKPSMELAEKLTAHSFADAVFLCNSGAEANEALLKMARKFFYDQEKPRSKFLSFNQSFHGRTMGALSATGQEKYRKAFEPLIPGFEYADFNDLAAVEKITEETAAVLVEPIQGEGGIRPARPEFLKALKERCDKTGALLLFDEVQMGMGRTGKLFAYEHYGIEPDMMSLAKGLGGGLPIGAALFNKKTSGTMTRGSHATTFGGNPVSAAAANAVLDQLLETDFFDDMNLRMEKLWNFIREEIISIKGVKEVRGKGAILGLEFEDSSESIFLGLRDKRLLINRIPPNILRILPPLTATSEDLMYFAEALKKEIQSILV